MKGTQELTAEEWRQSWVVGRVFGGKTSFDAGLMTLEGHSEIVMSVALSPDGRRIVSGSWDRSVRVWDAESGACVATLEGHSYGVMSVAFSPDGRRIVSGSGDKSVRVWDAESGACVATLNWQYRRV